ncbi:Protein MAIN-LIKE 1 [Bienertia sinuspersici]
MGELVPTLQINGQTLGITLEDVLFLTRLRIDGDPVLIKNYSDVHSISIFGEVIKDISELRTIALNKDMDPSKRNVAILMTIVVCFVMPSGNGITMYPAFLELLSDPDKTSDKYAWGAAILAYLQYHLQKLMKLRNYTDVHDSWW